MKKGSFEERLSRLEEISEKMRTGSVTLDEAVSSFEEGIKLARSLEKDLSRIEKKVEMLINEPTKEDEKPVLELFPELSQMETGQ
jgi:exodeoxyribonuclease VII small subunit